MHKRWAYRSDVCGVCRHMLAGNGREAFVMLRDHGCFGFFVARQWNFNVNTRQVAIEKTSTKTKSMNSSHAWASICWLKTRQYRVKNMRKTCTKPMLHIRNLAEFVGALFIFASWCFPKRRQTAKCLAVNNLMKCEIILTGNSVIFPFRKFCDCRGTRRWDFFHFRAENFPGWCTFVGENSSHGNDNSSSLAKVYGNLTRL